MNSVERVKAICKERKIPISKLEKDLEFGNGYIGQLRKGMFPADRLAKIAAYLSVSESYLLHGQETVKAPIQTDERTITMDDFTYAMSQEAKDLPQEKKDMLLQMARYMAEQERKKEQSCG